MLAQMVSISWPHDPPASASQNAEITGISHCARPLKYFKNLKAFIILSIFKFKHFELKIHAMESCDILRFILLSYTKYLQQMNLPKKENLKTQS